MPKKLQYSINLLPKDPFFNTRLGRFLSWSLGAGRYIVIFTELVVILCFASRFVLDRRVHDLNESIYQKQVVIQSQSDFEREFRLAQTKIQNYQQLEQQSNLVEIFPLLQQIIPNGLRLERLTIKENFLMGTGVAVSNEVLNDFISNLQLSPNFKNINVGRIESREEGLSGFNVQFSSSFSL
ncbi:MAG: hypothetical protein XD95_0357 [Microgenomates bacterium 39_7]|nr:MAG: hypothetical protein XD95_0357 [Microgenomates bacterium 39_7]